MDVFSQYMQEAGRRVLLIMSFIFMCCIFHATKDIIVKSSSNKFPINANNQWYFASNANANINMLKYYVI